MEFLSLRDVHPFITESCIVLVALLAGYLAQLLVYHLALRLRKQHAEIVASSLLAVRGTVLFAVPLLILFERNLLFGYPAEWSTASQGFFLCLFDALGASATVAVLGVVARVLVMRYRSESGSGPDPQVATRVLLIAGALKLVVWLIALALGLLIFPQVRSIGATLLASAGILGVVTGLATRPILENLIAGIQLALAQPLRLDDVIVVHGEYGKVEEITATYVLIRCWDRRGLVYPLTYFVSHPFENWTRRPTELIGVVWLYVDYLTPVAPLRAVLLEYIAANADWSGGVAKIDVVDTDHPTCMKLRVTVSAASPSQLWDLRCAVREHLIAHLQVSSPHVFPLQRSLPVVEQDG